VKPRYKLWARSSDQQTASLRNSGSGKFDLLVEAEKLARASAYDGGVVSVWVENDTGQVLWSAGEKSEELQAATTTQED
jgi:hypothetical protein